MRLSRLIFPVTIFLIFLVLFYQTQWSSLPNTLKSLPWSEATSLPQQGLLLLFLIFLNPAVATPLIFPDVPKKDFLTSQRQAALLSSLFIGLMLLMTVTTLGIPLFHFTDSLYAFCASFCASISRSFLTSSASIALKNG